MENELYVQAVELICKKHGSQKRRDGLYFGAFCLS